MHTPMLRLSFQQTPKKRPQAKTKTPVIQGIPSGTQRATVQAWHLREKERDLKNRKRFGWTDDDTAADWPHAAGAYRRIESANKGRRTERHARLERSQSRRPGCHSLPRNMSNGRHRHRPLFSLYKQLDHQRAVQRSIKFAENATFVLKITRWLSIGMCLKPCFQESNGKIQTANFSPVKNASRRR